MSGCVFCRIVAAEAPAHVVERTERTLTFLDIHPAGAGHSLIVPAVHVENVYDVSPEDWAAVWDAARRAAGAIRSAFAPDGLYVRQANGRLGGQEVMHLHVHLIPRYAAGHEPSGLGPDAVAERLRAGLEA